MPDNTEQQTLADLNAKRDLLNEKKIEILAKNTVLVENITELNKAYKQLELDLTITQDSINYELLHGVQQKLDQRYEALHTQVVTLQNETEHLDAEFLELEQQINKIKEMTPSPQKTTIIAPRFFPQKPEQSLVPAQRKSYSTFKQNPQPIQNEQKLSWFQRVTAAKKLGHLGRDKVDETTPLLNNEELELSDFTKKNNNQ